MKASPAPTVSATSTASAGTSHRPPGQKTRAPAPPMVTTTSAGPLPSRLPSAQRRAVSSGERPGWSRPRSSSLAFTTSLSATKRSARCRSRSGSASSAGRMFGSYETVAPARAASTAANTRSAPGARAVASDPVWTCAGAGPSSTPGGRSQVMSKP